MSKRSSMRLVIVVSLCVLAGICAVPLWIPIAYQAAKRTVPAVVQPAEQRVLRELLEPNLLGIPLIEDLEQASVSTPRRLTFYCTRRFVTNFAYLDRAWEGMKAKKGSFLAIEASSSVSPELLGMSRRPDSKSPRATLYTLRFERGSAYLGVVVVRHRNGWLIDFARLYTKKPDESSFSGKDFPSTK